MAVDNSVTVKASSVHGQVARSHTRRAIAMFQPRVPTIKPMTRAGQKMEGRTRLLGYAP